MRKVMILVVLMFLAIPVSSFAQHRYLGEAGARVLQCARFYSSLERQLFCVRGDELRAGQLERLGMLDGLSSDHLVRSTGGLYGYNGGDGYLYHTDASGRPMGTREKIVTGGAIGATLGAGIGAIFGRGGTGALLGAGTGAIVGAVTGRKASNKAKKEAQIQEVRQQELAQAQIQQAQARAEEVRVASREQKLLRNRLDHTVRVFLRSPDGRIEDLTIDPAETVKINPPRGSQLIIAEAELDNGEWIALDYDSGTLIRLPRNSGWEFSPGSGS